MSYKLKLKEGKCWRADKPCPLGKEFLEELYSWSKTNPLNPWLVSKVCDPCDSRSDILENFRGMKIGVYDASGKLQETVTVVDIKFAGRGFVEGTLEAKLGDGIRITAHVLRFARWLSQHHENNRLLTVP